MRKKVLWIEDGALFEAQHLTGPVFNSRKYDLDIALTISDAERELFNNEYDIIIVDIRMDPGDMPKWIKLYQNAGRDKLHARLGLMLLYALFKNDEENNILKVVPKWIETKRFGILTVENYKELEDNLKELGLESIPFKQKSARLKATALLEIIEEVEKEI
ncbi:MAG: hypothetical protein PHU88_02265 [candidate division Zixibacteria bacterium]|nr:hypothetical protein [candidate division Zixibacteria bacterium]MDD5427089.1 hypothetical protein [candidate division Zixibacteria bacterium]